MLSQIKKKFGSISKLAKHLRVDKDNIYSALNGDYNKRKLMRRIINELSY